MIETKKGGLLSSFIPAALGGGANTGDETKKETSKPVSVSPPDSPSANQDSSPTASPDAKLKKIMGSGKPKKFEKKKTPASPPQPVKKGKTGTKWEIEVSGPLDYGEKQPSDVAHSPDQSDLEKYASRSDVGKGRELKAIEVVDAPAFEEEDDIDQRVPSKKNETKKVNGTKSSGGIFSSLKSLVGAKTLTKEMIDPVMENLQEHLIGNFNLKLGPFNFFTFVYLNF